MPKMRKDINSLTEAELDDYIHAINVLRQRSEVNSDDPAGYDFQAALHNGGMFFPDGSPVGPCEHGSDAFLPWHRAHLHYFEKLLQEADPPRTQNVTIPYWDWISEQTPERFPLAFKKPGLTSPGRNDDAPLPEDTLKIVTTETGQELFAGFPEEHPGGDFGRLELGPHNYMHGAYIGGKMGSPATASEDPIYFSFHCFIDLMWAEWQSRNGAPPLTSPDRVLSAFQTQPKNKIADFAKTTDLDYEYLYTDKLKAAFDVPVPSPIQRELLLDQPLTPLNEADLTTELRDKERVQLALMAPPEAGRRLFVRLDELKVPTTGSYIIRGFVHPADVPFQPGVGEFTREFGVGYVALWRSNHPTPVGPDGAVVPHTHPASCVARFDVTDVLESSPVPADENVLTLQYEAVPGEAGQPETAELLQEVALRQVVVEVYS
jgi:tyrosinase